MPGAPDAREVTSATALPTAQRALQMAEQWVRAHRSQVTRLKDQSAAWRQKPVTPGQLRLLRSLGAPLRPGMTSGEASTLIDTYKARVAR